MAYIDRILNVPRQFVKSAIVYYESGQRGQKNHRGLTPEILEAVRLKIYIKETGKIAGAKGSLPLFAKHSLEGPCGANLKVLSSLECWNFVSKIWTCAWL